MTTISGPCPSCGVVAERNTYDIGSGPELSCANCEWCWGANGQRLEPLPPPCVPTTGWISGQTYCAVHGRGAGWPCSVGRIEWS
jgi:hypothetical protein